jgi:serine O-acetyltransferase
MIKCKEDLKRYLTIEKKAYKGQMSNFKWKLIYLIPFIVHEAISLYKYNKLLRLTEYYSNINKKLLSYLYKYRLRRMQYKSGIMIPLNTCKEGLRIQHWAQTRISVDTRIGKNCTIYPFVSIGTNKGKSPKIGDNVSIFSGARIIGDINIADNISVAANAVVTKSFDIPGSVLAGVPAKVLNK